jgi:hypothetical protein
MEWLSRIEELGGVGMNVNIVANNLRGGFSHVTGLELNPDTVVLAIGGTVVELAMPPAGADLHITVPQGAIFKSDNLRFGIDGKMELSVSINSMGRITVNAENPHLVISSWSFGIAEPDEMEREALDEIVQATERA